MTMNRRTFLKGLMGASAASVVGPSLLTATQAFAAAEETDGVWKTQGSHWGAFRARIWAGKVQEIKPLEMDPAPTDMLNGIKGIIYSSSRVRYPMVRLDWLKNHKYAADTRGNNRYVRVTWDEALDLFYRELEYVQKNFGPSGLFAGQTGWRQTGQFQSCGNHMQRAIAMHGHSVTKVGDYSTGAGQTILPYVIGSTEVYAQGTSWTEILEHTDNLIFWASDPVKNLQVGWNCEPHQSLPYFEELKKKIADGSLNVIAVDPVRSKTLNHINCKHRYVNPQTDVPFMLGIAHTLYKENLYDQKFLDTYCLGFKDFLPYLLGTGEDKTEKTPEWAEAICGVKADEIREFARMLAKGRTQFMFGWAIQRQQHGEQPYWMGVLLASMLGMVGLPGGGVSYSHHYSSIGVPSSGFSGPGGFPRNPDRGQEPKWTSTDYRGASKTIPVARWIDMLLNPGGRSRQTAQK